MIFSSCSEPLYTVLHAPWPSSLSIRYILLYVCGSSGTFFRGLRSAWNSFDSRTPSNDGTLFNPLADGLIKVSIPLSIEARSSAGFAGVVGGVRGSSAWLEVGGLGGQDVFVERLRGSNISAEVVSSANGSDFVIAAGLSGGEARGSQRWRGAGVSMLRGSL